MPTMHEVSRIILFLKSVIFDNLKSLILRKMILTFNETLKHFFLPYSVLESKL